MSAFDLLVDCVKDATKERDELAAALEQAQQLQLVTANTVTQQDELLNMYSERIETLEAALRSARYLPIDRDTDTLEGYAGAIRTITAEALNIPQTAGDTVTVAAVDVATDRIEHEIEGWNGDQTVPDSVDG